MKLPKDCNIILINLDGFREDKIEMCSELKLLKGKSIFFPNMFTAAPYTFASLHAVFSGMYPSRNGVNAYYNIYRFKKDEIVTLAQTLREDGYYTSCDIISEVVLPQQGFDEWNIFDEETVSFKERHKELIHKLSKKKKFFLFLHYTEVHKNLIRAVIKKYDQESNDDDYFRLQKENDDRYNSYLPMCDDYVATILQAINESGIEDNTILVFFSDHGTSIGEKKGEKFYGVYVYDYTINVFCMIKIPDQHAKIIDKQCRTIDLFPTIAEIAGISFDNKSHNVQGDSLLTLIDNPDEPDREVFVETGGLYGPWPSSKKHNVFCVRTKDKKLIYNDTPQTWEFYDLKNDPNENNNIYDEKLNEVLFLKDRLQFYFEENEIDIKIA